jgi:hypothetical protein
MAADNSFGAQMERSMNTVLVVIAPHCWSSSFTLAPKALRRECISKQDGGAAVSGV